MSKHYVMTDQDGTSSIATQDAPVFEAADYAGWEALSHEVAGIFLFMFKINPGAEEFPLHASEDDWMSYVVSGSGTLFSGDGAGVKKDEAQFSAGDFISFKPNTQHAWINGDEETKILFLKPSA